jgi:hypothetical protein
MVVLELVDREKAADGKDGAAGDQGAQPRGLLGRLRRGGRPKPAAE